VFGTPRAEVLRLIGKPSSWVSKDDPLFPPPRRDFLRSDSISFGSLTFSFDSDDRVELIMLALALECSWPPQAPGFPAATTTADDVAAIMRQHSIPFRDVSEKADSGMLETESGVKICGAPRTGRLLSLYSESQKKDV
jgi:hypothetical protein